MELKDLVGVHILTGVDTRNIPIEDGDSSKYFGVENSATINFVLDDTMYTVIEDPEDGYRSSMKEIIVSTGTIDNSFQPVAVFAVMRFSNYRNSCEILDIYDLKSGKLILSAGTDRSDDYYPTFVYGWTPENMWINKDKE